MRGPKAKAWRAFSDYIRLRDSIKTTGGVDYCKCVTCGHIVPYAQIQAGHAIGGRTSGILFDDEIVRGQCMQCNTGGGEYQMFRHILVREHGEEWYEVKVQAKRSQGKYTDFEYEQIAKEYRKKVKAIKNSLADVDAVREKKKDELVCI
jgi:hypothetical protein